MNFLNFMDYLIFLCAFEEELYFHSFIGCFVKLFSGTPKYFSHKTEEYVFYYLFLIPIYPVNIILPGERLYIYSIYIYIYSRVSLFNLVMRRSKNLICPHWEAFNTSIEMLHHVFWSKHRFYKTAKNKKCIDVNYITKGWLH